MRRFPTLLVLATALLALAALAWPVEAGGHHPRGVAVVTPGASVYVGRGLLRPRVQVFAPGVGVGVPSPAFGVVGYHAHRQAAFGAGYYGGYQAGVALDPVGHYATPQFAPAPGCVGAAAGVGLAPAPGCVSGTCGGAVGVPAFAPAAAPSRVTFRQSATISGGGY